MDKEQLLELADACKEQTFTELLKLIPSRMAKLDYSTFEGKATEEALALIYM